MIASRTAAVAAIALACVIAAPGTARAWTPAGHEAIEAAAYRRLVAREKVGAAGISGKEVLRRLIRRGVLSAPRCFEPEPGSEDAETCSPGRRDAPLDWWPIIASGSPDLLLSRQLGHHGQCFHFMADAEDADDPVDRRYGVPKALAIDAYARCVQALHTLADELLEDPHAARQRGRGVYTLIHAVGDSWSPAHAERVDGVGKIRHLKSWVLRDWVRWIFDRIRFSERTQHATVDERDDEWIHETKIVDGRSCDDFPHPYALPEECLTPRARRAVDAVEDLLILLEQIGPEAQTGAKHALDDPTAAEAWKLYLAEYFASEHTEAPISHVDTTDREWTPNLIAGLRVAGIGTKEASLLVGMLPFKRFLLPFLAAPTLAVGWRQTDDGDVLAASAQFGLLMPLFDRVALAGTPVAAELTCDLEGDCDSDLLGAPVALWYFHESGPWLSLAGPRFSWLDRSWRSPTITLSAGWAWDVELEHKAPMRRFGKAAWDPPPLRGTLFPRGVFARAIVLETSVASTDERHHVGFTAEARWNRSRFEGRRGVTYSLALGFLHGAERGGDWDEFIVSPAARYWIVPHVVAVSAEPALLGAAWDGDSVEYDISGRPGLAIVLGHLELGIMGPRLSYVHSDRRDWRPLAVRLAFLMD